MYDHRPTYVAIWCHTVPYEPYHQMSDTKEIYGTIYDDKI